MTNNYIFRFRQYEWGANCLTRLRFAQQKVKVFHIKVYLYDVQYHHMELSKDILGGRKMEDRVLDWAVYEKTAREMAAEGLVLLKNDNKALPLKQGETVSVFGRMQNHYYKSGTGSGGMVNVARVVGILDAPVQKCCHHGHQHFLQYSGSKRLRGHAVCEQKCYNR